MPSSVAAIISSSVCGPGSSPTLVIRTIGSRAHPDAVVYGVPGGGRGALVVVPERAQGARNRRVDRDVHQLRAVPQRPELAQVEPGRTGERRLPAEDAVQLDGVPDRLVDLQRELLAADDDGGLALRALRRGHQRPRLFGHPRGVLAEVQLVDQLPAAGAVLAPVRWVGAPLGRAFADNGGRDAGPALAHVLVDAMPLGGDEPLAGVPDLVDPFGDVGAGAAGLACGVHQQVALFR